MPFCPKCGRQLANSDAFCGQCGRPLNQAPSRPKGKASKIVWFSVIALAVVWAMAQIMQLTMYPPGRELALRDDIYTFGSQDALDEFESLRGPTATRYGVKEEVMGDATFIPGGTRVRVIKSDAKRRRIAPTEGNHAGKEGWVEVDWLAARVE